MDGPPPPRHGGGTLGGTKKSLSAPCLMPRGCTSPQPGLISPLKVERASGERKPSDGGCHHSPPPAYLPSSSALKIAEKQPRPLEAPTMAAATAGGSSRPLILRGGRSECIALPPPPFPKGQETSLKSPLAVIAVLSIHHNYWGGGAAALQVLGRKRARTGPAAQTEPSSPFVPKYLLQVLRLGQ